MVKKSLGCARYKVSGHKLRGRATTGGAARPRVAPRWDGGVRLAKTKEIAVLGLGNVLMGDDGFGPHVIATLRAGYEFTASVAVEDLGTPGLDLHPHLVGRRAVILVDTVRAEGKPGTLHTYSRDELLSHAPQPRTSPHDPGVKEALLALEFAGGGPSEVLLIGAIPATVEQGTTLSAPLSAAVPTAVNAVVERLMDLGCPARRRDTPRPPDTWWTEDSPDREAEP